MRVLRGSCCMHPTALPQTRSLFLLASLFLAGCTALPPTALPTNPSPTSSADASTIPSSSPAPSNPSLSPSPTPSLAPSTAPSLAPSPAPSVRFLTLSTGQERDLEAFKGVRVLTFWATWCSHCQAELPRLDPWAKKEARASWAWVPIEASQGSKEEVAQFKNQFKIENELYFDPSGAAAKAFGIDSYPTTLVLDAQGRIVFEKKGEAGPEAFQSFLPTD